MLIHAEPHVIEAAQVNFAPQVDADSSSLCEKLNYDFPVVTFRCACHENNSGVYIK